MRASLLEKLCCPFDKKDLELKTVSTDTEGNIKEGLLTCTHCKKYFPIIYGVPIMQPDEFRQPEMERPVIESWGMKALLP